MKSLIKVMLILAAIFATTFILGRVIGILTVENVRNWLEFVQTIHPAWVAALVIALLFIDLFVAVPTLTITILAGFFLGFSKGFIAGLVGMSLAAFCGYAIARRFGDRAISLIVKDDAERVALKEAFQNSGPAMIMLSRGAPIVPEVTACMAGATRMPFGLYMLFFLLSTVPYVGVAAYAGSISSVESPHPAIFAVIFLYGVMRTGWFIISRPQRRLNNV